MNKELDRIIRYVYNEFGQEFGDIIVDLKQQLQSYKSKEDKLRELCENVRQHDWEAYDVSLEILDILGENNND